MNATADMKVLAQEIAAFVTKVRKATTAARVVLVGHSQGGALARHYASQLAPEGEVSPRLHRSGARHGVLQREIKTMISCPKSTPCELPEYA